MILRSWAKLLKEELESSGVTFMWVNQRECNLAEISKPVRERFMWKGRTCWRKVSETNLFSTVSSYEFQMW